MLLSCYSRENDCLQPHDFHQHHIIYQKEIFFTQKRYFWNLASLTKCCLKRVAFASVMKWLFPPHLLKVENRALSPSTVMI